MKLKCLKPRLKATPFKARVKMAITQNTQPSHLQSYGRQWRQERAKFLQQHPLCVYCQKNGKLSFANVVDHIIPHKGDDRLFWDKSNWQPLCKHCHDSTKAKEEKQQGYR